MTEKYFCVINGERKGPFSIDELKELEVHRSTLVWRDGMDEWAEAKDIFSDQLSVLSPPPIVVPPPIDGIVSSKGFEINKASLRKKLIVCGGVVLLLTTLWFVFLQSSNENCSEIADQIANRIMQEQFQGGSQLEFDYRNCSTKRGTASMEIYMEFNGNILSWNHYEALIEYDSSKNPDFRFIDLNSTARNYLTDKNIISAGALLLGNM